MEVIFKKSAKTDALLYNGLPSGTSSECHCKGEESFTPSTFDDRDGVSVENVLTLPLQWFVLRVLYEQVQKAQESLKERGFECYAPLRYKQIKKQGKYRIVTESLLPTFLFVHTTSAIPDSILRNDRINPHESRPLLSYYYDHTVYRPDYPERNLPLTIRDEAMNNFIRLSSIKNPYIIPVTSE